VRIVYFYAFKYQSLLNVVATFLIKTISHWPPLYVPRSCLYFVLELLTKSKTSWSNSPSPSVINNYFSPLLFPFPFTPTIMIAIVAKLQLLKNTFEFSNGIHVKSMGTNSSLKTVMVDTMVVDSM